MGDGYLEIRSINHRYLEINIRLPEIVRELEQSVRENIHLFFKRGKVECSLRFYPGPKLGSLISINRNLLGQLIAIALEVNSSIAQGLSQLDLMKLLAWEGVVVQEGFDINLVCEELIILFRRAAEDLKESRRREGASLAQGIDERIENIAQQVVEIKKHLPGLVARQREKIMERLEEVKVSLDLTRLEQEMVYYAQRIDISEELERTLSHLAEVKRAFRTSDSAGRRLDFMMQELNREANTLASKSSDPVITHAAVEMKVLIEQIREQVQNIE